MKSKLDIEADRLCDAYFEKFGEPYPLGNQHSLSVEDMFKEIKNALETGRKVVLPKRNKDCVY